MAPLLANEDTGLALVARQEHVLQNVQLAQAWRLNQRRLERDVGHLAEQLESELRTREAIESLEARTRHLEARRRAWEDEQAAQRDVQSQETEARRDRVASMMKQLTENARQTAAEKERRREARMEAFASEKDAFNMDRAAEAEARAGYAVSVAARANAIEKERSLKSARQQAQLRQRRQIAEAARAAEQAQLAEERRMRESAIEARQRAHELYMLQQRNRKAARFDQKMQKADDYEARRAEVVEEMARVRNHATATCDYLRELAFQAAVTGRLDNLHARVAELSPRVRSPSSSSARRLSRPQSASGCFQSTPVRGAPSAGHAQRSHDPRSGTPRRHAPASARSVSSRCPSARLVAPAIEAIQRSAVIKPGEAAEIASFGDPNTSTVYGSPPSSGSLSNASAVRSTSARSARIEPSGSTYLVTS
mmetsp:Transcript_22644/g.52837  ORF Transcript_22644/g.52837 Transcript_22644/m.52837 type:complete len:424 (+) Transcript_22644:89-1360(+)